jgi:hypothetical protein
MTTVPSPAAMATRPTPVPASASAAETALSPGRLNRRKERFRPMFTAALVISQTHPHARLVGYDLVHRASFATGRIEADHYPTRETISHATGLTTAQVDVAMEVLGSRGFLIRRTVDSGPRAGELRHDLAVPTHLLLKVRAHRIRRQAEQG